MVWRVRCSRPGSKPRAATRSSRRASTAAPPSRRILLPHDGRWTTPLRDQPDPRRGFPEGPHRLGRSALALPVALLPAPERRPLEQRLGLDTGPASGLLGLAMALGGGAAWVAAALRYVEAVATTVAAGTGTEALHVSRFALVALGPLSFLLSPQGLALGYVAVTGLLRVVHQVLHGSAVGEPLLSLLLFLVRRAGERRRAARRLAELGPERPDRVLTEGRALVVLASREKPGWDRVATVQVGDAFYRVASVGERAEGPHKVLAYRLEPSEPGRLIRRLEVHGICPPLGPEAGPGPPAAGRAEPPEAPPSPGPPDASARWQVDEGEAATLTPDGRALVESRGFLPFEPRRDPEGLRPGLPGTAVQLSGRLFEVVEEVPGEDGVAYRLEPWRDEALVRRRVEYSPGLVRAAQRERRRAASAGRARRWSWLLTPLVGLLPEPRQEALCRSLGLDSARATVAGGCLELATFLAVAGAGATVDPARDPAGRSLYSSLLLVVFLAPLGAAAAFRVLAALAWEETAGSPLAALALGLWGRLLPRPARLDKTVLPLTRETFWARLALPDRLEEEAGGTLLVRSFLPHLTWEPVGYTACRLQAEGDWWEVAVRSPALDRGRLVYSYSLRPFVPGSRRPSPTAYRDSVRDGVDARWTEVLALATWLVALLPTAAQERAFGRRGGPAAARRGTVLGAAGEVAAAGWMLAGGEPLGVATGIFLLAEACTRLSWTAQGTYAPSLLGLLVADSLPPERTAYHAHRDAERRTLERLGRAG